VKQTLTRQQRQQVVQQTLADWQSAGATAAQLAPLPQVQVAIEALLASDLGEEAGNPVRDSGGTVRGSQGHQTR
jgi:hypothetical protein